MDVHIGSKDGSAPSWVNLANQVNTEISTKKHQWLSTLADDPGQLAQIEQEIHVTFSKLADHTVTAVLAKASKQPQVQTHQKKSLIQRLSRFGRPKDGV